jgi:hypothetical protein
VFDTHCPFAHVPSLLPALGLVLQASLPQHETAAHTPLVPQQISLGFTGQAAPFSAVPQAVSATHAPLVISHTVFALVQSPSVAQPTH